MIDAGEGNFKISMQRDLKNFQEIVVSAADK